MKTTIVITSFLILIFSFSINSCSSSSSNPEHSAKPPKENIYQSLEESCDGDIELRVITKSEPYYYEIHMITDYKIDTNIKGDSVLTLYNKCGFKCYYLYNNLKSMKFIKKIY